MKSVEPGQLGAAGIRANSVQPDPKQAHKGTIVHRRWDGARAVAIAGVGFFALSVQREADDLAHASAFALVVTLDMQVEIEVYNGVRNLVNIHPVVPVGILGDGKRNSTA